MLKYTASQAGADSDTSELVLLDSFEGLVYLHRNNTIGYSTFNNILSSAWPIVLSYAHIGATRLQNYSSNSPEVYVYHQFNSSTIAEITFTASGGSSEGQDLSQWLPSPVLINISN